MTSKRQTTLALGALALVVAIAAGCGASEESQRKSAQANADKYYELISAGNYAGAYKSTFSDAYRDALELETFVRYQEGYAATLGHVQGYKATQAEVDTERGTAELTYALDVSKVPEPVGEVVRLSLQGTEWRIDSIEPKFVRQHPGAAPPPGR